MDPPRRLVYRWCIAWDEEVDVGPTTRVELSLTTVPGWVILRVRESGFGSLPPGMIDGNAKGWDQELRHLAAYAERSQG